MPTIINGCGTWYCGKRRIHRVKAGCSACGAFGELESYDTTLYFVFFMVPIIPLGQKRILQSCPVCRRHRVVRLKDWEAGKAQAFNKILNELKADPDNRETIQKALALATVYQDEVLFDKVADALAGHRTEDAEIQAQLGSAYEYFSRWPDAEAAYRRSLAVQPTDDARERLAVCLLKQGRPEEAADFIRHVFESKDPDKAWLIFWLVEGFMARGMHEAALKVMDVRDEFYPRLARSKDYQRQRRTAQKHLRSGKPVKSAYLAESGTGFREGSRLGFGWPKYVAAAVILGLVALYLGSAFYRGEHRKVYLVNGTTKQYAVRVNGEDYRLPPGGYVPATVPEGEITVDWPDAGDGPQTVRIETSFFGRPFHRPVFVLNPDRLALVERDETVYSDVAVQPDHPPDVRTGQLLHEFADSDYEFEAFPSEIQSKSKRVTKTRVGLVPAANPQDRLLHALSALPPDQVTAYLKRVIQVEPDDAFALQFVARMLPPAEAIDLLRTRLGDRPIRVEWHRMYQSLMEVSDPAKDLKPEYRKLVEETKRSPDAVYLLGRLEDGPVGDTLYLEAARANPPSVQACTSLSFRYLARGDFAKAVEWGAKARDLSPRDPVARKRYVDALLAAGKYAEVLQATAGTSPADTVLFLRDRLTAHVGSGEPGAAEGEVNRLIGPPIHRPGAPPTMDTEMRLLLAEVRRDRAKYLELVGRSDSPDRFAQSVLTGNYKSATQAAPNAKAVRPAGDWEDDATRAGLLYLAGLKAKDQAFADQQWKRLVDTLAHGDREARACAAMADGEKPFDADRIKASLLQPSVKRVVLAAFARRFPAGAKELNAMSKELDFDRDEYSLCLRYVTE